MELLHPITIFIMINDIMMVMPLLVYKLDEVTELEIYINILHQLLVLMVIGVHIKVDIEIFSHTITQEKLHYKTLHESLMLINETNTLKPLVNFIIQHTLFLMK
jgi:hypothetical protein